MDMVVVAIYDAAAAAFSRPVFVASRGLAVRSFQDECRRVAPDNMLNSHPEDFVLHLLGTFDDSNGQFHLQAQPEVLFHGRDCK